MKLHKYKNYQEYKEIQVAGNIQKLQFVAVEQKVIKVLSDYLKQINSNIRFGLCHGTRRGLEQQWFREFLGNNVEVIGTEISPTAKNFPFTIEWDFHNIKNEWVNAVDFIYSNSLDHSYQPEYCLDQWMRCVRTNKGVCILEWNPSHDVKSANKLDPFGASKEEYIKMLSKKYKIKDILSVEQEVRKPTTLFIVEHPKAG